MDNIPKTKKFNGKTYRLQESYLKSSQADWDAGKLRSKGWSVRVVNILGLHCVYKRRP